MPIANNTVNAVAMTVLPDAPVDPITGLQVPTIAVATGGGVSVIKHNGTVVSGGSGAFTNVTVNPSLLSAGKADTSWYYAANPGSLGSGFTLSTATGEFGRGNTSLLKNANRTELVRSSGALVTKRENNASTPANSLNATITNLFNTGHQPGDIRRTYLSDNVVESVSGPELVTNGTFDTDTTGWTTTGAVAVASSGVTLTNTGSAYPSLRQTIAVTGGRPYRLTVTHSQSWVASGGHFFSFYAGSTEIGASRINFSNTTPETYSAVVVAPAGATAINFQHNAADTDGLKSATWDNISVKEVIADRSYKAKGATIIGTLTKSAVAPNAQLVAYSGFSAANYLQEPYSADLDFGTGEWSAGAWVKNQYGPRYNLWKNTEDFSTGAWGRANISATSALDPDGNSTAWKVAETAVDGFHFIYQSIANKSANYKFVVLAKAAERKRITMRDGIGGTTYATFDLASASVVATNGTPNAEISSLGNGWCVCTVYLPNSGEADIMLNTDSGVGRESYLGVAGSGVLLWHPDLRVSGTGPNLPYQKVVTGTEIYAPVAERSYLTGAKLSIGFSDLGYLTATAYDGTTTRTVTTTAAYNTATWLKAEAVYKTDGSLAILVNGQEVAVTRGNPLLTLNNSNAVLTIGNSYALDAPFPGSIALLKLSATAPTYDQAQWMYEQEKQLFRDGAQCCLPDSGAIVDLTYDDVTDKWVAVSATNESSWTGLVRTNVTAVPAGSNSRVVATSGVKLNARTTTSPGVDVTIPAYGLREELLKDGEDSGKLSRIQVPLDYVGGFTATTVTGNTAITSVAGLSYPSQTTIIGARVSGTGIPANTTIVGVSGTTIYLSAAATAAGTAVQISFVDFVLPLGMEAKEVISAGAIKTEGATKDFTRLYDGFRETIRFGTAPGYTAAVQIIAIRSQA